MATAEIYTFVGVNAIDAEGVRVTVSAYIPPPAEGEVAVDPAAAMNHAKSLAKSMGLTLDTGVAGNGASVGQLEVKEVGTVVRRTQKNTKQDGTKTTTPAIELYPVWNPAGTYGKWRFATHFLNNPEDVESFEKATNLKLAEMPAYQGLGAPPRVKTEPEEWEVVLDPPRRAAFTKVVQKNDEGEEKELLRFHHWIIDPV